MARFKSSLWALRSEKWWGNLSAIVWDGDDELLVSIVLAREKDTAREGGSTAR